MPSYKSKKTRYKQEVRLSLELEVKGVVFILVSIEGSEVVYRRR